MFAAFDGCFICRFDYAFDISPFRLMPPLFRHYAYFATLRHYAIRHYCRFRAMLRFDTPATLPYIDDYYYFDAVFRLVYAFLLFFSCRLVADAVLTPMMLRRLCCFRALFRAFTLTLPL